MAGTGQLGGFAGRVLAVLLVLSTSCAGASEVVSGPPAPLAGLSVVPDSPIVVDTGRAPLTAEHAEVVRSVHRALVAGDLDALRALYAGDDWAGQAQLLASPAVRSSVLDALRTHPANLGEGYLYPGFSLDSGLPLDHALPDNGVNGWTGYQTAFFLDYDPPSAAGGPLRWRGIALPIL